MSNLVYAKMALETSHTVFVFTLHDPPSWQ